MLSHQVKKILGTTNGKCRYQDVALRSTCHFENVSEFFQCVCDGSMQSIAIGTLEQHRIRVLDSCGLIHDRCIAITEISAEHQRSAAFGARIGQYDNGRPKDVPGIMKAQRQAGHNFYILLVTHAPELLQAPLSVLECI